MPSSSNNGVKLEKQLSIPKAEASTVDNIYTTPINKAIIFVEHKIRNLEKRKTKLESYRAIQFSGKELSNDQKTAVAKYNEVAQSLDLSKEFSKQLVMLSVVAEKDLKKQARKDAIVRAHQETAKIREVLIIQNILIHFCEDNVRDDFLNGTNGAIQLEKLELDVLEKFFADIQIIRKDKLNEEEKSSLGPFSENVQKAAEYLSMTVDARTKAYSGDTTFENIKGLLQKIKDCGYFDKLFDSSTTNSLNIVQNGSENGNSDDVEDIAELLEDIEIIKNEDASVSGPEERPQSLNELAEDQTQNFPIQETEKPVVVLNSQQNHNVFQQEAPAAATVPVPVFANPETNAIVNNEQQQQIVKQINVQGQLISPHQHQPPPPQQIVNEMILPNPNNPQYGQPVEQAYYKQHYMQIRPLADVIGGGNFFFLQDSEIDSPDALVYGSGVEMQNQEHKAQIPIQEQQNLNVDHVATAPIPTQTFTNQSYQPIPIIATLYSLPPNTSDPQAQQQPQPTVFPSSATAIAPKQQIQPVPIPNQQAISAAPPNPANLPMPGFPRMNHVVDNTILTPNHSMTKIGEFNEKDVNDKKMMNWTDAQVQQNTDPEGQPETNQWNSEIIKNNASNNGNSKSPNEWKTHENNENNHWNSNQPQNQQSNEYNNRQNRTGPHYAKNNDRNNRNGSGNVERNGTSGGANGRYNQGRSGFTTSQQPPLNGRGNSHNNNGNAYFRNNESYYQNNGGFNKDNNTRFESGNGTTGNNNYRSRNNGGGGSLQRSNNLNNANRNNSSGGGGPRLSGSSYPRTQRQQDINA